MVAYLSGLTIVDAACGPSVPPGWELVGATNFNGDAYPDYALYKASTGETVIAYLDNIVVVGAAFGRTLPLGCIRTDRSYRVAVSGYSRF